MSVVVYVPKRVDSRDVKGLQETGQLLFCINPLSYRYKEFLYRDLVELIVVDPPPRSKTLNFISDP